MAIGRAPDNPVLVIERDADLLSAVGRALRSRGHEVVAVPTVDEGIAQLRMRGACFIVLGLTDLGEGRRFREHQLGSPTLGEIPVLVYADAADAVVNDRAFSGAVAHLRKPPDLRELTDLVDHYCLPKAAAV